MRSILKIAGAAFAAAMAASAGAAEIKVVSSIGMKAVLEDAKPLFEYASGHKLALVFGTAVPLKRQIEGGESFDVAILTPPLIGELATQGKVVAASAIDVAKTSVGLAVRKGAAKPDIGTPDGLKRALLDARAVARSMEGQSGAGAVNAMERLGVSEEMKPRILLETRPGGPVMAVKEGKADLAFALASEIVPSPEVDYLGPLPAELQAYVVFTAGISSASGDAEAAKVFVQFVRGATVAAILKAKGME